MDRAFIHIGTHKTGSTSFQQWASARHVELAETMGLTYYNGLFQPSHFEFPMLCLRSNRSMPMRAKIPDWCLDDWQRDVEAYVRKQVRRPVASLLVSAEALSYLRYPDEVERLVDLVRPRAVSVVVVLREPSSFLSSYKKTMLSIGFPPSRYHESFAYVDDNSWLVDYDALVRSYEEVLGAERVLTVDYELALQQHGSVIPAILDAWNLDLSQAPSWDNFHLNVTPRRLA